jgi:hypothetical protein
MDSLQAYPLSIKKKKQQQQPWNLLMAMFSTEYISKYYVYTPF